MYENKPTSLILFATPPPLEQLCAITISLSKSMQSMTRFQPQVIKCREFIFTEPEVIGTPSADIKDHFFHLVAKVSLMNSGKLQTRLARIGLEASKPYSVSTELYESCLRYTLIARLSPAWNKAGPWLIQGRDFLTHKGYANAVKIDVSVHHNELFFTLEATVLKLSPLQVTDLDIVGKHLEHFLSNPSAQLDCDSIASNWCFILPSMKRGRIVRICHEIPEDSPFMTYRDLKRHWKNTYGYRLPENEDGMNFYQINFGPLGGKLFTYPEVCLRGRDLQKVARVDPKPILRAFLQEIQNKFPTVCGCPIKLQSKAKFPYPDLLSSGQKAVQNQPNLTNKMNSSRPAVYRTQTEMEKMLSSKCAAQSSHYITSNHGNIPGCNTMQVNKRSLTESEPLTSQLGVNGHNRELEKDGTNSQRLKKDLTRSVPHSVYNTGKNTVQEKVTTMNFQQTNQTTDALNKMHMNVDTYNTVPKETRGNCPMAKCADRSNSTSEVTDTPRHSSQMNSQIPLPRKLFPQFKPKKLLPQMEAGEPVSCKKIVPIFHPQKKLSSTTTISAVKSQSTVNKPFIPHNSAQVSKITPCFQAAAVSTSYKKGVPSFSQKSVSSCSKSTTSNMDAKGIEKKQSSEQLGKGIKEQKDRKATKRPKTAKNNSLVESKRAKKLKKPEA